MASSYCTNCGLPGGSPNDNQGFCPIFGEDQITYHQYRTPAATERRTTVEECWAEAARRRTLTEAERKAEDDAWWANKLAATERYMARTYGR